MIRWTNFPRNKKISTLGRSVVEVFEKHEDLISSGKNNHLVGTGNKDSHSNSVLLKISKSLNIRFSPISLINLITNFQAFT
jgi:hypothetical protein